MDEANDLVDLSVKTDIQGYDIDPSAVRMASENAQRAGVDHMIHLQQRPVSAFVPSVESTVFIITNSSIVASVWRRRQISTGTVPYNR